MEEELQPQQNTDMGEAPAQQAPISSSPTQPTESAVVPVTELPAQEPVESESPPPDSSEDSTTPSEPQRSNDATTQPSEETVESAIPETIKPSPEQPSTPAELQQPDSSATPPLSPTVGPDESEPAPTQPAQQEPQVIERVRELNESEKRELFRNRIKSLSPKGVSARRSKRQANYDKIIAHLKTHGYIANDEVEEICKVKDSTARKYLNDLEKQGILLQIGSRGRRVRYRLTAGNQ